MAVHADRVRRHRTRRIVERSTIAVCAVAVIASVFQFQTAAGERAASAPSPSVPMVGTRVPDVGVWVVVGTSEVRRQAVAELAEANASAPSDGTSSTVVAARAVVTGKVHDVLTNAATVGELLSAMGITPGALDRVLPPPSTPLHDGITVRFDQVRVVTRRVHRVIPTTTHTTFVGSLAPGRVRWIRTGSDGALLETYRVRVVNGAVVSRRLLGRRVLRPAVPGEREVGRSAASISGSQIGEASWYDAPGSGFTAASPWLPFGTRVTVTNLSTGESVVVVIDDRGPFGGRIIDLSPEAFSALAPLGAGVMQVRLTW